MTFDSFLGAIVAAQADDRVGYAHALQEIQAGRKHKHWIWYVFPVLKGVRKTSRPQYEIQSLECAQAWLRHQLLGPRLVEITTAAVTQLEAGADASQLFGSSVDAVKFHNCMTLFAVAAAPQSSEAVALFQRGLQALGQQPAQLTIEILSKAAAACQRRADIPRRHLEDIGARDSDGEDEDSDE
jgi:uncharacterized protein (DUF1810 family)